MIAPAPQERPTASQVERRVRLIDALVKNKSEPVWRDCCKPMLHHPSSVSIGSDRSNTDKLGVTTIEIGNWHKENGPRHNWKFFIKFFSLEGLVDVVHVFLVRPSSFPF